MSTTASSPAAPGPDPAQPTRPLSKLQERIGAETAARALAGLETAGRIRRLRGQAVVPVRGYAREDFDQEITLVEDASVVSEPAAAEGCTP